MVDADLGISFNKNKQKLQEQVAVSGKFITTVTKPRLMGCTGFTGKSVEGCFERLYTCIQK